MNHTEGLVDLTQAPAVNETVPVAHQREVAISWGAVIAGGTGAAAFALILLTLGTGLGLASISFWSSGSSNARAFGFAAVIWVCVTAVLTSGLGGYLAGRLRHRWLAIDADEMHFRDTVHGFLSWAVATLFTAAALASTVTGIARVGAQNALLATAGGAVTVTTLQRGNAAEAMNTWPIGYLVDSLFRTPAGSPPKVSAPEGSGAARAEATRVFLNAAATGDQLSREDTAYLAQVVAQRTGLAPQAAQARVLTTYERLLQKTAALDSAAKLAAERARRATIATSLWLFVSLLMGAFSASLMATYGGRARQI